MDSKSTGGLGKLNLDMGPVIKGLLDDPAVIEIMLNEDGILWAESFGAPAKEAGSMDAWRAKAFIGTVAVMTGTVINDLKPTLSCELPIDGSRFQAAIPPVSAAPVFSIRKHMIQPLSLADYITQGVMSKFQREAIEQAVFDPNDAHKPKKNILIAGGTGSGKTTLANAVIGHISEATPSDRLMILEDTREIRCRSKNHVSLKAIKGVIDLDELLTDTLRYNPDRIIVGEVRDPKPTLTMLMAWNTGHPGGVATIHANSAIDALMRVEKLVSVVSSSSQKDLVASVIDTIIFVARVAGKPSVREVVNVKGHSNGHYLIEEAGVKWTS